MREFKPVIYRSFAEFFDREFRPGARTFVAAPNEMAAFTEARYFGWDRLSADQQLPIKKHSPSAEQLLGSDQRVAPFLGGPVLLARLSPMDYHHVHYPDDGATLDSARLGRSLWTVNWHALQNQPDILLRNERQIDILETKNFGRDVVGEPDLFGHWTFAGVAVFRLAVGGHTYGSRRGLAGFCPSDRIRDRRLRRWTAAPGADAGAQQ